MNTNYVQPLSREEKEKAYSELGNGAKIIPQYHE